MLRLSRSPRLASGPPRLPAKLPVLAAVLAGALVAPLALAAAAPRQAATPLYLPDLQAEIKGEIQRSPLAAVRPQGQEGLGNAVVDVQNLAEASNTVQLDLAPKSGTAPATLRRGLGARRLLRFDLGLLSDVTGGFYAGRLGGSQAVGGAAHLRWVSGASAAYEAAPAAKTFILPLVARTVYSHTTILYAQNTDEGEVDNEVSMSLFDAEEGSFMVESSVRVAAGETFSWDTAHAENTFGPDAVGTNAPTGGWLGHAWFEAGRAIAVMAYGDELEGQGSSAYLGRPVAAADRVQYLPLVRSNYQGDTLIAIANAGERTANVTLVYQGADFSPSGAGETFGQQLKIVPRGAVFVDLSARGRGSRPAAALPRGAGPDAGFVGTARIEASEPVLAVAQDEQLRDGRVDSVSAYNAFGPADLGTDFMATTIRKRLDYQSSALWLHNPGYIPIEVRADLADGAEAAAGQLTATVAPGGLARLPLAELSGLPNGLGRARLRASGPFAALVADERDPRGVPAVARHVVYIRSFGENHTSGIARLTEKGRDLEVAVQLNGLFPGGRYGVSIRRGECPSGGEVAYTLTEPVEGKSTTLLRSLGIAALTATPHIFVVEAAGWRGAPARDVACGVVEPMPGAEVVDTSLSWPVRLVADSLLVTPTPAPATATAPTATPLGPTPSPTATGAGPRWRAVLPLAYR